MGPRQLTLLSQHRPDFVPPPMYDQLKSIPQTNRPTAQYSEHVTASKDTVSFYDETKISLSKVLHAAGQYVLAKNSRRACRTKDFELCHMKFTPLAVP